MDTLVLETIVLSLVILGLLLWSATMSASETAIFNLGVGEIRDAERKFPRLVKRIRKFRARRQSILVTLLLGNLLANISLFSTSDLLAARIELLGAKSASYWFPVLVLAMVIFCGELIPKFAAIHAPFRVARLIAVPLLVVDRFLLVPRIALGRLTEFLIRLVAGQRPVEGELSSRELGRLLEVAAREGHLMPDESERLQAVLVLAHTEVREIMVPRVQVVAFRLGQGREALLDVVAEHRRNKIPVFKESIDRIEGFLDAKEVLARPTASLESLIRPIAFVPSTAQVSHVIDRFRNDRVRLMVVVDEYGGTEGLITQEDLVEAVVGDLSDESDSATPSLISLGVGTYSVDGGMSISSWGRLVSRDVSRLPVNTVGGLVTFLLDRIPRPKDVARIGSVTLEVLTMKGRRPQRVVVKLDPPKQEVSP